MTTEPTRFVDRKTFDFAQVEAALCVYDWMLEARDNGSVIDGLWDGLGSPGMRMLAMQAGDVCARVYAQMETSGFEYTDPYDFEFVPAVCGLLDWDKLCNDNQYGGPAYDPDVHGLLVAMIAADKAAHTDPQRRSFQKVKPSASDYITLCRREAERQFGYGDLVSDHADAVTRAMELEEEPAAFIKWLGEKYDLTPRGEMM